MGSESCPHCGKPFKRLKSHLPHCKAAEASGASQHEAPSTQKTSTSSLLSSKKTEKKTKGEKSTPALSLTVSPEAKKKTSALSAPQKSVDPSSSSQALLSSSRSTSTTKKKLKLADQIQLAASVCLPSSTPPSLSPPALPSPPTLSKPIKKGLRALIEAAKNKEEEESLKRSGSALQDLLSVPTSHRMETGLSTSGATALTRTGTSPDGDPNSTQPALVSADTKPKGVSKKKVSKREEAAKSMSTDQGASASQDGQSARPKTRDNSWLDSQSEGDILSGNLESTYGSRITLQGVKATLGRHHVSHQSSRLSILDQIQTTDDQPSKTTTRLSPSPAPAGRSEGHAVGCLVTPVASSEKLPSTMEQCSSPVQTKLTPLLPLISPYLIHTLSMNKALKVDHQLPSQASAAQVLDGGTPPRASLASSNPAPFLLPPPSQNVPARSAEGPTAEKKPHVETLKLNSANNQNAGWQWYYRRYTNARKRGVGGVGLLIAGVCVLGYVWTYPPKSDRWRKYH
ncbi:uncharacterized protein LOC143001946 isoform X2 [Genypterus blacodes]|uniref:uncharacterized protein LOC143001946 isoform X2 n=1 Tax=Genypterus blacodes TaxID=154954 RepID=UPI003F77606C